MTTSPVVVTGLGATTPVGGDVEATWSALLAGKSGVVALTEDWAAELPVRIAAPVAVDPSEVLERVQARRLDRSGQLALIAAREAWADAGAVDVDPERLAVVVASGIGGVHTLLSNYDVLKEKGPRRVSPLAIPMLMPNGPAASVALEVGARGGVHTPVSACSSGAEAVAYGLNMIRSGRVDVVIAGGTEAAIHPLPLAAFANMMALSRRNDEPARASRPYDKARDGFVLGEGAGIVVLESADRAARRGARIYAEVAGAGLTSDAHHIAQPDPVGVGATRAMKEALADANLRPDQIVHINAHATSTPQGDVAEALAIRNALGEAAQGAMISATKSMTGHLLGAAGAVEGIATILALHHRLAPPTINLDDPDDEVRLDVVRGEPRALPDGTIAALNNSFGFGGHNVAVALRSYA
ncbi:MAG: beta-ketoacyl-ACP synthase II [Actinomycetes bacterium]|jgi:3-oxoacyl-[acyl-carrier-protein] synthase II|nr:beta-ketoacyl-ACP synthase II [Actinomycetes bacterium]